MQPFVSWCFKITYIIESYHETVKTNPYGELKYLVIQKSTDYNLDEQHFVIIISYLIFYYLVIGTRRQKLKK